MIYARILVIFACSIFCIHRDIRKNVHTQRRRVSIDEYTMLFALILFGKKWTSILRDKESCTPILYNCMYKDEIIIKKDNLYSLYHRIIYLDINIWLVKRFNWDRVNYGNFCSVNVSLDVTLQRRELVTTLSKRGYIDHSGIVPDGEPDSPPPLSEQATLTHGSTKWTELNTSLYLLKLT